MLRSTALLLTGILFTLAGSGPAAAQDRRPPVQHTIVFGLEHLAGPDRCGGGPYGFYRLTCVHSELNVSHSRSPIPYNTILDRLALAGAAWFAAFALFLLVYGPMLLAPRATPAHQLTAPAE